MQISNNQNQHFTGCFRIKPNEIKAKTEIPELFTQGKQIFHNILEKGDEVIVLRDNYDKRVTKYVQENQVKDIEYFPTINTKSGLDSEQPEGLITLLNDKTTKIITDIQEMLSVSAKQRKPKKVKTDQQAKSIQTTDAKKETEKVANALRLNIEKPKISSTREVTRIRDEQKKRTIELISPNKGLTYVYVKPDSLSQDSIKCIIDGKGNIVKKFETPNEIHKFLIQFREMKRANINIIEFSK